MLNRQEKDMVLDMRGTLTVAIDKIDRIEAKLRPTDYDFKDLKADVDFVLRSLKILSGELD